MASRKLVAASSIPILMAVLAQGESYGYAIIARVRALSGGELDWTEGMLYPVLHRLEKKGLVKAAWRQSDTGRERKYYALTAAGRTVLAKERDEWDRVHGTLQALWAGAARG
ncbi:MAG: PadR family transcriptional regulator [Planctomycetota bacterium]|nr:PadR family transcriptional regulator [Planctomycetota bacterium]